MPTLLLTVAGRETGVGHTTLGRVLPGRPSTEVTGSAGGSATGPPWFRNRCHADRAMVHIGLARTEVGVAITVAAEHAVLCNLLACFLASLALVIGDGQVAFDGFADVVVWGWLAVLGAGWASGSGLARFWRPGW